MYQNCRKREGEQWQRSEHAQREAGQGEDSSGVAVSLIGQRSIELRCASAAVD